MNNSLQEPQVLYMFSMRLYALHKMLDNFLINFIAKHSIVLEYGTHSLGF